MSNASKIDLHKVGRSIYESLTGTGSAAWRRRATQGNSIVIDPHHMYSPAEVATFFNISYDTAVRRMKEMKGCVDLGTKETRHKRPKAKLRVSGKHLQAYLRNREL